MKLNITHLALSWSISRGQDTYGYNICRLDDRNTGKRYRCMGGGYDMTGTVFGDWLQDTHQDELKALVEARKGTLEECGYSVPGYRKLPDLYGLTVKPDGKVSLDGACGIESMIRIAEALGYQVDREGNRKGNTIGFYVGRPAV